MMYPDWYRDISAPFRGKRAARAIRAADKLATFGVAFLYVAALTLLAAHGDARIGKALVVPTATFALITIVRTAVNAPRPYERFPIDPVIHKDTHGKSLPSRHVASAVIIAGALLWLDPRWGAAALVGSVVLAFTRIVGGVHFPRDIVAAACLSALCAVIGFAIVP